MSCLLFFRSLNLSTPTSRMRKPSLHNLLFKRKTTHVGDGVPLRPPSLSSAGKVPVSVVVLALCFSRFTDHLQEAASSAGVRELTPSVSEYSESEPMAPVHRATRVDNENVCGWLNGLLVTVSQAPAPKEAGDVPGGKDRRERQPLGAAPTDEAEGIRQRDALAGLAVPPQPAGNMPVTNGAVPHSDPYRVQTGGGDWMS